MLVTKGKLLKIVMWLIALHSLVIGIGLIILSFSMLEFTGFDSNQEGFFSAQGGVFHIAMAVAYSFAAFDNVQSEYFIIFSIIVKLIASIFLFTYYFFIELLPIVILSGIVDFLMALIIIYLYNTVKRANIHKNVKQ